MRPKKHYVAAEIGENGLVFDSDQYNCKLADSAVKSQFTDMYSSDADANSKETKTDIVSSSTS